MVVCLVVVVACLLGFFCWGFVCLFVCLFVFVFLFVVVLSRNSAVVDLQHMLYYFKTSNEYQMSTEETGSQKKEASGKREREMFYLTTHSTHFIYGHMASDIWLRTIMIVRKETRCRHICYSYPLTARVLLYAPTHI